jgi:hypothetical protein
MFAGVAEPVMKKPKLAVPPVNEGFELGAFDDCASSVRKLLYELDTVTAAKFMVWGVCACVNVHECMQQAVYAIRNVYATVCTRPKLTNAVDDAAVEVNDEKTVDVKAEL